MRIQIVLHLRQIFVCNWPGMQAAENLARSWLLEALTDIKLKHAVVRPAADLVLMLVNHARSLCPS
jgi:hypothetical protein